MTTIEDILQASEDGFFITFGQGVFIVSSSPDVCVYKGDNLEHAMLAIEATRETT